MYGGTVLAFITVAPMTDDPVLRAGNFAVVAEFT